jgi:uncharacterized linocin/CFP29 family protein
MKHPANVDYVLNGHAQGDVAQKILACNGDISALRPFIDKNGRSMVTINGKNIVSNNATLRFEDWREFDKTVHTVARERLKLVKAIRSSGLEYKLGGGLGTTVFSTERMTDPGEASMSMDGLRQGKTDRPEFDIVNLPMPIIHSDFNFSVRQILASRRGGSPLDLSMIEASTRRVAEKIDDLHIGNVNPYSYGGGVIYGITNFPDRITYTIDDPSGGGWDPTKTVDDVLAMKQASVTAKNFGPWMLVAGTAWDQYLDRDYVKTGGNNPNQTLRDRLRKIDGISDVITLDQLTGFQLILVQKSTQTIRSVVGIDFTTVQWETHGGMQFNFKVMASVIPQLRCDINGNCGVVHGSV